MANLLDIAPARSKVPIAGQDVEVFGISVEGVVALIRRFPSLVELMTARGGPKAEDVLSDPLTLIQWVPDAVKVILAAGTGFPSDEKHEEAASRIGLAAQIDLLGEILKLTLPEGAGPLVRKVTAIFLTVANPDGITPSVSGPPSSLAKPHSLPNGKDADTNSQLALSG